MARTKQKAPKNRHKGDPGQPSDVQSTATAQTTAPFERSVHGKTGTTFDPDRLNQIQQVDSWRAYRDGTNSLQNATGFEPLPQSHPSFWGSNHPQVYSLGSQDLHGKTWAAQPLQGQQLYNYPPLGQQLYPVAPLPLSPPALPFHPSSAEHSHFKPYQPLRVSNGTHEKQIVQQAKNTHQSQPQSATLDPRTRAKLLRNPESTIQTPLETRTHRYPLRQRGPGQIAPFSTGAADRILQSVEPSDGSSHKGVRVSERTIRRPPWNSAVTGPAAPSPTVEYMKTAALNPILRDAPAKLLVILDLNGTLLVRPSKKRPKNIIVRPGVPAFLNYLFQHHVVMVYSSARPQNCAAMIEQFLRPGQRTALAAVWARDKLCLTPKQYDSKVQVYKKLEPIWQDTDIQRRAGPGRVWDQSNTVLVDDSKLKALAQPHNLLQIPEFVNKVPTTVQAELEWRNSEEAIVQSVQQKLEELKWQVDVSRLIREWQTGKKQAPGVVDETVDQKALQQAAGRTASLTTTPSISDREPSSESPQLETPGASPLSITEEDRYKPIELVEDDLGVSPSDDGGAVLDYLENRVNRNLSLVQDLLDVNRPRIQLTGGAALAAGTAAIIDRFQRSESIINGKPSTDLPRGIAADPRGGQGRTHHIPELQKTPALSKTKGHQGSETVESDGSTSGKRLVSPSSSNGGKAGQEENQILGGRAEGSVTDAPMTPESLGA